MRWDPAQYLRFADERTRPAIDLLARVRHESPGTVFDLGCGPGNTTRLLRERWPAARLAGVDGSADMLERARLELPDVEWLQADLATWRPAAPADVLFSNATFQWLGDHARLFPALMGAVAPGGVLAVQMPRNFGAPSHTLLAQLVRSQRWRARLDPLLRGPYEAAVAGAPRQNGPVAAPERYHDLLAPIARAVDIWETEYLHTLDGPDPVLQWTRGTALRPFVEVLSDGERVEFETEYAALTREAYPARADGTTLFPFRRLFIVATRA